MSNNINPISTLYNEIMKIIRTTIIKYSYEASQYETAETLQAANLYIDAMNKLDTFLTYRDYLTEDFNAVGITNLDDINNYIINIRTVPAQYQEPLLQIRRARVINTYVERNDYYRMMLGLPPIDMDPSKYHYVTDEISVKYGIPKNIPIHQIYSELGPYYASLLWSIGIIDNLINDNPTDKYLSFIYPKQIDLIAARQAKNFSILYISNSIHEVVLSKFKQIYDQCREYYLTRIYIYEYRGFIEKYDNICSLCIMVMGLEQLIAQTIKMQIDREFFDESSIRLLFDMYNIPYTSKVESNVLQALIRNINILLQNKGTNKVLYDVSTILGYSNMSIFKYYLVKEHKLDSFGNPIFAKTTEVNSDTGMPEEVYDFKQMYDVYFQKIELLDYDYFTAIEEGLNKKTYNEITENDPLWVEDASLHKELYESEFNYVESKYMSIGLSYKLTKIVYEQILLIKTIIEERQNISNVTLQLPKIVPDVDVNIFDSFLLLLCYLCKLYNLSGQIIDNPLTMAHVIDNIDTSNGEAFIDSMGFNFEALTPENYNETVGPIYGILTKDEQDEFDSYLSILSIDSNSSIEDKIKSINSLFSNIKNMDKFLNLLISKTKTVDEFHVIKRFYQAIFYTKENLKHFRMGTSPNSPIARTYLEYLGFCNPLLYNICNETLQSDIYINITHIISRIEEYIDGLQYLYMINEASSPIEELLINLINFFKSYTINFLGLDVSYILDFKIENLFKMTDMITDVDKTIGIDENYNMQYSDTINKTRSVIKSTEKVRFRDDVVIYEK